MAVAAGAVYATVSFFTMTPAAAVPAPARPEAAEPVKVVFAPSARGGNTEYIQNSIHGILNAGSSLFRKTVSVGKGDTLMDLLVRNHVPREQAYGAIEALKRIFNPRDLNPSHRITVFFHQTQTAAEFSGLSIQKDVVSIVRVSRSGDSFTADQQDKAVHPALKGFRGTIDSSLFESAEAAGMPDSVTLDLIKMYSFGVDFQRDLQPGDKFEVMYSQPVTEDGATVPGREEIVYANLILSGRAMPLYRYKDASGDADYYDASGQGAKKPLMKTPIDGARISSRFGMRVHPVLGYTKMHKGIDFAAPRGTPIYAAGDGVIEKIGPFSSYGKYVRIRHRAGLETAYAHMNGFKPGLRAGSRVKQGQVIGYVGATGRATGAHLHYEIMLAGAQVNPATVKLSGGKALAGKDLKGFKAAVPGIDREFSALGRAPAVAENRKADTGNTN
jgi:murein DD-endopeptidase MepM/ murein hydrolase activator NlpD